MFMPYTKPGRGTLTRLNNALEDSHQSYWSIFLTTTWVRILLEACKKAVSDFELGSGSPLQYRFRRHYQMGTADFKLNMEVKMPIKYTQNSIYSY